MTSPRPVPRPPSSETMDWCPGPKAGEPVSACNALPRRWHLYRPGHPDWPPEHQGPGPPVGPGKSRMGLPQDPRRAGRLGSEGRSVDRMGDPPGQRHRLRPVADRADLVTVPAFSGRGDPGVRLLHGRSARRHPGLRPGRDRARQQAYPHPRGHSPSHRGVDRPAGPRPRIELHRRVRRRPWPTPASGPCPATWRRPASTRLPNAGSGDAASSSWTAPSSGTRTICGGSCAITRPTTISTGLTAPCTAPRRSNRDPNRSILSGIASEDRLAPTARSTNIAWPHDVDEVFGTHRLTR